MERARELLTAIESEAALLSRRAQDVDAELGACDDAGERARLVLRRMNLGFRNADLHRLARSAAQDLAAAYPEREEQAA